METINLPILRDRVVNLERDFLTAVQQLAVGEIFARLAALGSERPQVVVAELAAQKEASQRPETATFGPEKQPVSAQEAGRMFDAKFGAPATAPAAAAPAVSRGPNGGHRSPNSIDALRRANADRSKRAKAASGAGSVAAAPPNG